MVKKILERDRNLFKKDLKLEPVYFNGNGNLKIIADFTEYSPLHLGHKHCMDIAKQKVPDGIFVAVVPGLFERSGRGLPYIMTREARAETAVAVGADVVVEGPPMGIMGSGQYSLCLAKMFKAIDADFIPRGYKPFQGFERILNRIENGTAVSPKPYRMVDMDTREVVLEGKLDEDNYVIASLSKSLKKVGFNFKDKFIFVKRVEGVSGTRIRESVYANKIKDVESMMPTETVNILKDELKKGRAPLSSFRDVDGIVERVNNSEIEDLKSLAMIDEKTLNTIIGNRPFNNIFEVEKSISQGFSRHFKNRVLSSLEAGIFKKDIHNYIDRYPSVLRILKYKNKEVLNEFRKRIPHRRLEIWQ